MIQQTLQPPVHKPQQLHKLPKKLKILLPAVLVAILGLIIALSILSQSSTSATLLTSVTSITQSSTQSSVTAESPLSTEISSATERTRSLADESNVRMTYRIPIVYVWLGPQLPSRYKKRLEWITFPYKLLGQSDWLELGKEYFQFQLSDVRRSDILRLLYLKHHGGIYADLDNIIDYDCLMQILADKKGFYMLGQPYAAGGQANAFLFVDRAEDQEVNKILEEIKVRLSKMTPTDIQDRYQTGRLTGPYIMDDLHIRKMDDVPRCVKHEADVTWVNGVSLRPQK